MTVTRMTGLVKIGLFFSMVLAGTAAAAESCQTTVGRLATVEGQVEVQRTGNPNWQAIYARAIPSVPE